MFRQQRISIHATEEDLARLEVEDAFAATPAERMAAAIELLDPVYELWIRQGFDDHLGLFQFPRCTQERRIGIRSNRRDSGSGT